MGEIMLWICKLGLHKWRYFTLTVIKELPSNMAFAYQAQRRHCLKCEIIEELNEKITHINKNWRKVSELNEYL
jgi:hypothetical protein